MGLWVKGRGTDHVYGKVEARPGPGGVLHFLSLSRKDAEGNSKTPAAWSCEPKKLRPQEIKNKTTDWQIGRGSLLSCDRSTVSLLFPWAEKY